MIVAAETSAATETQPADLGLPSDLSAELTGEVWHAILRVERKAYTAGWVYGLLCGLVCGSLVTGVALLLLNLAAGAWGDVAARPIVYLPGLTT